MYPLTIYGRRGKQDSGFCLLLCFAFTKIKYLCAGEVENVHSNFLFLYGIWVSFNLIFTIYAFLDILFSIEHSPGSISSRQRNKRRSILNTNMGKIDIRSSHNCINMVNVLLPSKSDIYQAMEGHLCPLCHLCHGGSITNSFCIWCSYTVWDSFAI